jgi:hypothetical protein
VGSENQSFILVADDNYTSLNSAVIRKHVKENKANTVTIIKEGERRNDKSVLSVIYIPVFRKDKLKGYLANITNKEISCTLCCRSVVEVLGSRRENGNEPG